MLGFYKRFSENVISQRRVNNDENNCEFLCNGRILGRESFQREHCISDALQFLKFSASAQSTRNLVENHSYALSLLKRWKQLIWKKIEVRTYLLSDN